MELDEFKARYPDLAKQLCFRKDNGMGDPWQPCAVYTMPRIPNNAIQIRQWCLDNLTHTSCGLRDRDYYFWFFEDPEEAMWFRLTWNAASGDIES